MIPTLAQPQTGHLVELVDLLIDCEPSISANYPTLVTFCSDYKDKEFGEAKIAELLIKFANSTVQTEEKQNKTGIVPGSLYFQTIKPSNILYHSLIRLKNWRSSCVFYSAYGRCKELAYGQFG